MSATLSTSLSDRQGFNRRWFAPDTNLVLYRPQSSADVLAAVTELYEGGYDPASVQATCGRHCYEGFVYNDATRALIDLTGLKGFGTATVNGAETLYIDVGYGNWDMYRILNNLYQKMLPAGSCYSVGLGGHITGGGYGFFSRLQGLTIDYLTAADIVIVDPATGPQLIQCSATSHSDLYWAVRGAGGGQFGIITRYYFATETLPDSPSYMFTTTYTWDWYNADGTTIALTQDMFNGIVNTFFFGQYCNQSENLWNIFGILHGNHKDAKSMNLIEIDTYYEADGIPLRDYVEERKQRLADRTRMAAEIAPLSDRDCRLNGHPYVHSTHGLGVQLEAGRQHVGYGPDQIFTYLEGVQTLNGSGPNRHGKYKSAYHITEFTDTMLQAAYAGLTETVTRADTGATVDMSSSLIQFDSYGGKINTVAPSATAIPQRSSIGKLQYQTYWIDNLGPQYNDEPLQTAHLNWINGMYGAIYADTDGVPSGPGLEGCYYNYPDIDLGSTADDTPPLENALELYFGGNLQQLKLVAAGTNANRWFSNEQSICNATIS
ncbi:FAD-binding protein [Oceaniradius stylonematis]|uniref:FAD-binding protein n=1 Tax=Oceaniradius stylonematis TaxID=2184161 RepID=UPI00273F3294|nr:FAD-binding protein [Oceaniradius stylonematis]